MEYESPRTLIQKGMRSFRDDNDVPSSLDYFNRADNAVPDGSLKPYLWQRGISYYYLDLFREGSDQVCVCLCVMLLLILCHAAVLILWCMYLCCFGGF